MSIGHNYTLKEVLSAIWNLNQEKWVDKILNLVKEKIFWNKLNEANIEEFKRFVRRFTALYYLMKDKFAELERSSWERYFEHLREVVINTLSLPNPNTNKVLIAIAHDSIEDTNKTFEWLNEDFWYEVAIAAQAISKDPWEQFEDFSIEDEEERMKLAKKKRNEEYFWHLESFEKFKEHVRNIAKNKLPNKILTEEEIETIAKNALDVKFADRVHNLSTQWHPDDLEQVEKKVLETEKYFLNIARENNPVAYEAIKSLLLTLRIKLSKTPSRVEDILKP